MAKGGSGGQGNGGGWPSTTGNPSGGGRSNNSSSSEDDDEEDEAWARYHTDLVWQRFGDAVRGFNDHKAIPLQGEANARWFGRSEIARLIIGKPHMWEVAKSISMSQMATDEFENRNGIKFTQEGKAIVNSMRALLHLYGDKATSFSENEIAINLIQCKRKNLL